MLEVFHILSPYRTYKISMDGLVELRIPLGAIRDYCELTGRYSPAERRRLAELIPILDDVYLAWRREKKT